MLEQDDEHTFAVDGRWSENVLKHGFTIVPNILISGRTHLALTPTEFYVFVALESYRWDNTHSPFPSLTTLAKQTGLHKQTVYRATNALEIKGLLVKHRRFSKSTVYDLRPANEELDFIAHINNGD